MMKWRGEEVTADAIIFGSAQNPSGKNIAIMGDAAEATITVAKAASTEDHITDDGGFDVFESIMTPRQPPNPGLDIISASLERFAINSATFGRNKTFFLSAHDPNEF